MVYVKWVFWSVFWFLVAAIFHYTLPQTDVARVVGTFEQRVDFGENAWFWSGADAGNDPDSVNRDVLFIQTVRTNDRPMVYRNEDTGWSWPPYFKFDTKNLQTEAADLQSTKAEPQWVAVRHYGWRNEFFSIFPNAVGIKPVDGPDYWPIPWLNILILLVFFAIVWAIWVRLRRFRQNRIDPLLEGAADKWDRVDAQADAARGRFRRWWDSFKGPSSRR